MVNRDINISEGDKESKIINFMIDKSLILPKEIKTIKVEAKVWDSLKSIKKENETFNDVIKELLMERTKSIGNENVKLIKYQRKTDFFNLNLDNYDIGYEFEYNDIKSNKSDFIIDAKIKKIFFKRSSLSPTEFFGVDGAHKHYSSSYLVTYLAAIRLILHKEFGIYSKFELFNLTLWRKLYYDYSLSEESFKLDIEEPLRLSEEEAPSQKWKDRINNSILSRLFKGQK